MSRIRKVMAGLSLQERVVILGCALTGVSLTIWFWAVSNAK